MNATSKAPVRINGSSFPEALLACFLILGYPPSSIVLHQGRTPFFDFLSAATVCSTVRQCLTPCFATSSSCKVRYAQEVGMRQ
jgi:hypothetical protein